MSPCGTNRTKNPLTHARDPPPGRGETDHCRQRGPLTLRHVIETPLPAQVPAEPGQDPEDSARGHLGCLSGLGSVGHALAVDGADDCPQADQHAEGGHLLRRNDSVDFLPCPREGEDDPRGASPHDPVGQDQEPVEKVGEYVAEHRCSSFVRGPGYAARARQRVA